MSMDKIIAEKIFSTARGSAFFSRLTVFGAAWLIWLMAFAVFLWGALVGNLLSVACSFILSWVLQLAIAFLLNRRRPFQQNHEKPLLRLLWSTPSFPSGHTTLSCAMAAAVFAHDPFWGGIFFVMAALVAFCRIAVGVHYFSDIIGGAVLGISVAAVVSKFIL